MWKSLILPLLAAVAPIGATRSADEINVSKGGTLAGPGLAVHGYDVVAFFTDGKAAIGSDAYAVAHAGGTYRFTQPSASRCVQRRSRRNTSLPMAASAPTALRSARSSTAIPATGRSSAAGSTSTSTATSRPEWSKDIPGNLAKADTNWGRIHGTPVDRL